MSVRLFSFTPRSSSWFNAPARNGFSANLPKFFRSLDGCVRLYLSLSVWGTNSSLTSGFARRLTCTQSLPRSARLVPAPVLVTCRRLRSVDAHTPTTALDPVGPETALRSRVTLVSGTCSTVVCTP
jgi:hypothetical protein